MAGTADNAATLSIDEQALLLELLSGRSDKRVALRLATSDRTVRRRVSVLMRRYGVGNRFALGVIIGSLGVLPAGPAERKP